MRLLVNFILKVHTRVQHLTCQHRLPFTKLVFPTGVRVFATARKMSDIEDLATLGIETLTLDVLSPENITEVRNIIEEKTGGKLDILVNNAGRSK
jgi:NADP-dependent 3-hydroxy acid dehydrogenase YdfG